MISLVQIPVHRCYTGNTVRLEGYGHGSYWLTYVHCSDYKCNDTVPRMQAEVSTRYKSTAVETREADVKPPLGVAPIASIV